MGQLPGIFALYNLARLYGLQTAWYDVRDRRRQASVEPLLTMLASLGAPVTRLEDVADALRQRQLAAWQRLLEPVIVAWDGGPVVVPVRLPSSVAESLIEIHLQLESGRHLDFEWAGANLETVEAAQVEGTRFVVKHLPLPVLPPGYHRLALEVAGRVEEALVISAPVRAYTPDSEHDSFNWGVFLPLYALHTKNSWGSGDLSDFKDLIDWVGGIGGNVVATLPLLAAFQARILEPSPYLPSSRLLWNEFYVDVTRSPYLAECPPAQALVSSPSFQKEIEALRKSPLVDYQRQVVLKRQVLHELSRWFFTRGRERVNALWEFAEANPTVDDYARFCAACEKRGASWPDWPQPLRAGVLSPGDYDDDVQFHLFVQWLAHQQMDGVSEKAREKGVKLYLDLPLGVHPEGYDVWRERELFLSGVSAGAPPDRVFTTGQNWSFPPHHPEKIREQGYRYTIAYLRHHFEHAGILRIDHVMGLHRLFCIPEGMAAGQGVYLRYHAEELYAILSLESHRHRTVIVGEDLGMVPPYVRPAMRKHDLQRMYILHYELATLKKGINPAPHNVIASLNTHDMPPFAGFWQGLDIPQRAELGVLKKADVRRELSGRKAVTKMLSAFLRQAGLLKDSGKNVEAVYEAVLTYLAGSRARTILVNLEDLWSETRPQNVPSTRDEYPNWRRKARYSLDEFCRMPRITATLHKVNSIRKRLR
jgi:4-alpha-glucanotransferase